MRVVALLWLMLALASQGAVARVHLMPSSQAPEAVQETDASKIDENSAAHGVEPGQGIPASQDGHAANHVMAHEHDCHMVKVPPVHDCCDNNAKVPMDCHSSSAPCDGECGHCKVYSPTSVALLPGLSLPQLGRDGQVTSRTPHYLSIALDQEIPPPFV